MTSTPTSVSETLPVDETGNGTRLRTLVFDEADAPMLMHALTLEITRARMCGGQESAARIRHYRDQFAALSPKAISLMKHETDLCEIAVLAASAPTWTMHRIREADYVRQFRIVVTVGGRAFASRSLEDETAYQAIAAMVADVVPLTCVRTEHPDKIGNPWFV